MTFYKCEHCGNIIAHLVDSGVRCVCCGTEINCSAARWRAGSTERWRRHVHNPATSTTASSTELAINTRAFWQDLPRRHPVLEDVSAGILSRRRSRASPPHRRR